MTARRDASRREALKTAAIGASGVALALGAVRVTNKVRASRATEPDKKAEASAGASYLAEFVGLEFGDYRVVAVEAIERGGVPVHLSHRGESSFRVDVLRADPTAAGRGIGAAGVHAVYLRNGGNGRTATDERNGLGAMALAAELSKRELAPPKELLTMDERAALDASAARA
jgi:hypothetical protein